MLDRIDRTVGLVVSIIPAIFLVLIGASQIVGAALIANALLFHRERLPPLLVPYATRLGLGAALAVLFGVGFIAVGVWMGKGFGRAEKFKL